MVRNGPSIQIMVNDWLSKWCEISGEVSGIQDQEGALTDSRGVSTVTPHFNQYYQQQKMGWGMPGMTVLNTPLDI